ncbi:MAG: molybdenum ABC transporter ATP-binding protein [Alphaproteobacteria bacterium]|nr:molybdenum ABC transporter ATP-binding protein [Alphaproteobacteria bacterium]
MSAGAGESAIEFTLAGRLGDFALDVVFAAPMRGVTALFGPSGSGKTTILRCAAGLQRLSGRLQVGEDVWQDDAAGVFRPPHRRPIGYVFQEASLFPHLSVRDNLRFGAKRALPEHGVGALDFADIVKLLGIGHLLDRAPAALSGGERQRVAIGRALLSQPRLLLMDEPLASLDRLTKDEILPHLEAVHESLAIPILYVSHDIGEIERLADTLVLLENGRVAAAGELAVLQADLELPLARAPEAAVTLEGAVVGADETYALTTFAVAGGTLIVPGRQGGRGDRRRLRISASDVSFSRAAPEETTILNCLPVRIHSVSRHDRDAVQMNIVVGLGDDGGGARIVGRVTRKSQEALGLTAGRRVFAQIKSVALLASGAGGGPRHRAIAQSQQEKADEAQRA